MEITINGQSHTLAESASLADLLLKLELEPRRVAVERNKQLVPRGQFALTALAAGDVLEIVSLVGGG